MSEFLKASTILCFLSSLLFNFQVWILLSAQRPLMIACLCINDRAGTQIQLVSRLRGNDGISFRAARR